MEKVGGLLRRRTFAGVAVLALTLCVSGLFAVEGGFPLPRYGEYAFDNSVSNEFWCTWGWVEPAPAQETSSAVVPFDFSGTVCASSALVAPFYRESRKGLTVTFR